MTHETDERGLPRGLFPGLVAEDLSAIDEEELDEDAREVLGAELAFIHAELQASLDALSADLAEIEAARARLPRTARRAGRTPTRRSLRRRSEKGRSSKKMNRE